MKLTDETWYMVRKHSWRNRLLWVVAPSQHLCPTLKSTKSKKRMGVEDPKHNIDFTEGEVVVSPMVHLKGFDGAISEIDTSKGQDSRYGQHVWPRHASRARRTAK